MCIVFDIVYKIKLRFSLWLHKCPQENKLVNQKTFSDWFSLFSCYGNQVSESVVCENRASCFTFCSDHFCPLGGAENLQHLCCWSNQWRWGNRKAHICWFHLHNHWWSLSLGYSVKLYASVWIWSLCFFIIAQLQLISGERHVIKMIMIPNIFKSMLH